MWGRGEATTMISDRYSYWKKVLNCIAMIMLNS